MTQKKLSCACWNNKDLFAEFDWLFDDGLYTESYHIALGFIRRMPCKLLYDENHITIWTDEPSDDVSDEIHARAMFLQEDSQDLVVRVTHKRGNRKTTIDTFFMLDE